MTKTPEEKIPWYRNAIFYQIYPWSFKDSNGDGVGDLEGIISKLDYLAGKPDSLGINAIWLSPIFPSPMKDFGYDISDFYTIDARFGNLATFARLISEAHKRGIKIILDLVTNHTSSEHPWFIEAQSSKQNPKRDWYVWKDPVDGKAPNNWLSVPGDSAWTFDEKTGQYYLHQFLKEQPDLNWRNTEVQAEFKKIMEYWIGRGVDGFRVDAISHLIEDSKFRSEPFKEIPGKQLFGYDTLSHLYSKDQPELAYVIKLFSDIAHQHKDTFIINETYLHLDGLIDFYKIAPYHNEAPFHFGLVELPWDAQAYRAVITAFEHNVPAKNTKLYVLGNHDLPRLGSRIGVENLPIAAMLLLTLPGSPFIYYGEELGMTNGTIQEAEIRDGFSFVKREGKKVNRDVARTPMPWTPEVYGGFSTTEPWLPLGREHIDVNVRSEQKDQKSLLSLYKKLIATRKSSAAFATGTYRSQTTRSPDVFSYMRSSGTDTYLVMLNFSGEPHGEIVPAGYKVVQSTYMDDHTDVSVHETILLRPQEGVILKKI